MSTLRAEIFRGTSADGMPIGGATVAVTGSALTPWSPSYGATDAASSGIHENPSKTVALEAFGGPVYVAIGAAPDPTVEPRCLVRPGLKVETRIRAGDKVSAINAADVPA